VKSEVPYVRLDGVMVATSWDDLTDGTILHPFEVDELGGRPNLLDPCNPTVWTGTLSSGSANPVGGSFCADWTQTTAPGDVKLGRMIEWREQWTVSPASTGCAIPPQHLYCFEQ
jgi:hypothetical protein